MKKTITTILAALCLFTAGSLGFEASGRMETLPIPATMRPVSDKGPEAATTNRNTLTPQADLMSLLATDKNTESISTEKIEYIDWASCLQPMGDYAVDDKETSATSRAPMRAGETGTLKEGVYITIDASVLGRDFSFPVTFKTSDTDSYGDKADNCWEVTNIYGLGTSAKAIFDPATGILKFAAGQVVYEKEQVKLVKIRINDDGSITVRSRDAVTGKVNADGSITMDPWGLVSIDENNKAQAYNLFTSSRWVPSNGTVSGNNLSKGEAVSYPILVENIETGEVKFYGLSNYGDIVVARPSLEKTLKISPQFVVSLNLYGDFYIYSYDVSTKKVNWIDNIILTPNPTGFTTPAYAIAQRSENRILGGMTNVRIETTLKVSYPEAPEITFAGDGTQNNPYQISTSADLLKLSALVESGMTFEGKYITLKNDIDLSSLQPGAYYPVGDKDHIFQGTFNGNGKTLKGLKLDGRGYAYVGIFGYVGTKAKISGLNISSMGVMGSGEGIGSVAGINYGVIENCNVTNSQLFTEGAMTGGIAGASLGTITNCSFKGNIQGIGSQGGIIGQGQGKISGCHVSANIRSMGYYSTGAHDCGGIASVFSQGTISDCAVGGGISDNYGRASLGGIVGRALTKAQISRCLNVAAISGKRLSKDYSVYLGGLTAITLSASFTDCVNAGTILINDECDYVGGLVGSLSVSYTTSGGITHMDNISKFTNCHNTGQLMTATPNPKGGLYGYTFVLANEEKLHPEDVCFINCTYDRQINNEGEEKYGRLSNYYLGTIPQGYDPSVWTAVAGSYPMLKTLANYPQANISVALPVLSEGHTAKKVKTGFKLVTPENVSWSVSDGTGYSTETSSIKISGNDATIKNQYDNILLVASSADGWAMKFYRLALVPKLFDGEGTEDSPYLLKNVNDFLVLSEAVGKFRQSHSGDYFAVANDIDFNYNENFKGIGYGCQINNGFGGVFDGRGHALSRIDINSGADMQNLSETTFTPYIGLFNQINKEGVVKNVTLAADCKLSFYCYSGAIAGFNRGRIENCRNNAPIVAIERQNGGIAGVNYNGAVISGCYNSGNITGHYGQIGGITSYNCNGSTVEYSQNDGDITLSPLTPEALKGADYKIAGGITGFNYGDITGCLNQGTVTANESIAGIIGYNEGGNITGNLSTGLVNCRNNVTSRGAIIGLFQSAVSAKANYYDNTVNLNGAVANSVRNGYKGLSTMTLIGGQAPEDFPADKFDFRQGSYPVLKNFANENKSDALRKIYIKLIDNMPRTNLSGDIALSDAQGIKWTLDGESNFSLSGNTLKATRPTTPTVPKATLKAVLAESSKTFDISSIPVILKGSGTASEPYLIETAADWNKLADFVESSKWEYSANYFRIVNDIDFAGDSLKVLAHSGVKFDAILDGNHKTVKGFVYSNGNGFANNIAGPNFYIGDYIGLIGAVGPLGSVKDLRVEGTMNVHSSCGGIVGNLYGTVENCVYAGTLTCESGGYLGGIAYRVYEGAKIINCVNEGTIRPFLSFIGGITYQVLSGGLVEGCVNRGKVGTPEKSNYVCGIACYVSGTVRNCHNNAPLLGSGSFCGIAFSVRGNGIIEDCSNTADMDISEKNSGLFGIAYELNESSGGTIRRCFNSGSLSALSNVFGIVAVVSKTSLVSECYNTGDLVSMKGFAGGIAYRVYGDLDSKTGGKIEKCYNTGNIHAGSYMIGGIAGELQYCTSISDCYNTGDINVECGMESGLSTGGIVAESRGNVTRCFNTGEISGTLSAVGGITGWLGGTGNYIPEVSECFNLGDIHVIGTKGNVYHGRAGGISGSTLNAPAKYINCFNAGNVYGDKYLGGIVGQVFSNKARVENCYSSGRVVLNSDATGNEFSHTVYARKTEFEGTPFHDNFKNVYYDATAATEEAVREVPGSAKTTGEFSGLDLGEAFKASQHGGYPILANHEKIESANIATAMILLHNPSAENHSDVFNAVTLVGPEGSRWISSNPEILAVESNIAKPVGKGNVKLICSDQQDKYVKTFILKVDASKSSIEDTFADKTIESAIYFDLSGRQVDVPVSGNVYLIRYTFTDGTSKVVKTLLRR